MAHKHLGLIRQRPSFVANAVTFNATTNYLSRGANLTGLANSTQGIFSGWFRVDGLDGALHEWVRNAGAFFNINRTAANKIRFTCLDSGGSTLLAFETSASLTTSALWFHVLASWDTNFSAGNKVSNLYLDGASNKTVVTDAGAAANINYASGGADWAIGADTGGLNLANSSFAELYFAPGQFLDFTNVSNQNKFRDPLTNRPISLGADGSTPTGTAPLVYLKSAGASYATNSGTGGNFTAHGTFSDASSSPSN